MASDIRRAKRRGLLRNVCVALGNSKDTHAIPAFIPYKKVAVKTSSIPIYLLFIVAIIRQLF
jgi:epoxyqueuosine reductase QueG